jgi:acyl-CoA thioesterase YciA
MKVDRSDPALRVTLMPKDTNPLGTIFGGIILSYIDQAGAVEALRHCGGRLVTVAMREVEFHEPVFVGDLVSFYTNTLRVGTTSITVKVTVEAVRRYTGDERVTVTEAEVVYVHVDDEGRPIPVAPCQEGRPGPHGS